MKLIIILEKHVFLVIIFVDFEHVMNLLVADTTILYLCRPEDLLSSIFSFSNHLTIFSLIFMDFKKFVT